MARPCRCRGGLREQEQKPGASAQGGRRSACGTSWCAHPVDVGGLPWRPRLETAWAFQQEVNEIPRSIESALQVFMAFVIDPLRNQRALKLLQCVSQRGLY